MAKTYPFSLDPFQLTAVACLERKECVLVAAHTSAGKTAVAEYAIAMSLRDHQKVVYTSPLKALSNQKYRELSEEHGDVGYVGWGLGAGGWGLGLGLGGPVVYPFKLLHPERPLIFVTPFHPSYLGNDYYQQQREQKPTHFSSTSLSLSSYSLLTGDVTINANAPILVMTTEILRSMLYRGSEILQELAWVIFDEVHYMQDKDRGVVWEETIIFLDPAVKLVFLSATLSNTLEFCAWVTQTRKQPCHVVYTEYRPTPLTHYAFPRGGSGLYLLKDEKGVFKDANFDQMRRTFGITEEEQAQLAVAGSRGRGAVPSSSSGGGGGHHDRDGKGSNKTKHQARAEHKAQKAHHKGRSTAGAPNQGHTRQDLTRLLPLVKQRKLDPCIIFSFSRRECEQYAMAAEKLNFNSSDESAAVEEIFTSAVDGLGAEDQDLPAITSILRLLKQGVGIHHSGLLPILKEVVEILFQEQLIKVLFATETFAMGLNMPARTVIFTATQKWDGEQSRFLSSGECIQMSGRAGRRGKDDRGVVIMMVDENMGREDVKTMIAGVPAPLISSFRLSYYTLLNLIRSGEGSGQNLTYVLRNSFTQFQHDRSLQSQRDVLAMQEAEVAEARAYVETISADIAPAKLAKMTAVANAEATLAAARTNVAVFYHHPLRVLRFLRPGRLVRVQQGKLDFGWGVMVALLEGRKTETDHEKGKGKKKDHQKEEEKKKKKKKRSRSDLDRDEHEEMEEDKATPTTTTTTTTTTTEHSRDPKDYVMDVLLLCASDASDPDGSFSMTTPPRPPLADDPPQHPPPQLRLVPVRLPLVTAVSTLRVGLPPDLDVTPGGLEPIQSVLQQVVKTRGGPEGVPRLGFVTELGYDTADAERAVAAEARERAAVAALAEVRSRGIEGSNTVTSAIERLAHLEAAVAEQKRAIRDATLKTFEVEAERRTHVLTKLGLLNEDGLVTMKGRAACAIDTADELVTVELMFNGVFSNLDKHQLVSLVACLIPVEKTKDEVVLSRKLAPVLVQLQDTARHVARVSRECRLELEEEKYVESFRPSLMDVVYSWSTGAPFAKICLMTEMFEGSIIRHVRRLYELMGQLEQACAAVGETELEKKFRESAETIHRDVMFAASLYI